jgi:hypothetical protein
VHSVISVPETLKVKLVDFLNAENIGLQVTIESPADLLVHEVAERKESDGEHLFCGGWIECGVARSMADRLGVQTSDVGKLLDFLNVKIRNCELGCF